MLDSPLMNPKGKFFYSLTIIDIIITSIFTLESLIKIMAYGIIMNGNESYFRNLWNIFDFIIVVISVIILFNIYSGYQCSWSAIV